MTDDLQHEATASWKMKLLVAAAVLAIGGVAGYHWTAGAASAATGCSAEAAKAIDLVVIDTTDRLTAANPARVTLVVRSALRRVPGGGLLGIWALDADTTAEATPAFLGCAPPRPGEANPLLDAANPIARHRSRFEAGALDTVSRRIVSASTADWSPLVEQITKLVTDARIAGRSAPEKRLTVVSDLLQASAAGNAYNGPLSLPQTPPRVLEGWHVRFVQTTNPRDAALQTEAVRAEWRRWAIAAGAVRVTFEGPGLPPVTE